MEEKSPLTPVNYLYFGAFFLLLALMSASSVLLKEYFLGSRIFFLLYALGQAVLEIGAFIFLAALTRRYLGSICYWIFIGATFFLILTHILDFMMDRILDLSVWNTIGFVLDETFSDFLLLLDASGIPLWLWGIFFFLIGMIPLFGMLIYKGTDLLANKRPMRVSSELFLQMFVCIPLALFIWDCSASRLIHPDAYNALIRSLPWKFTFLRPKNATFTPKGPLLELNPETSIRASLEAIQVDLKDRPNIYLIITESLRGDYITPEIAPHLSQFRDEHIHFEKSLSNGNTTMISWFSTLHSQFSLLWKKTRNENWSMGSPPLNLLKKWGYQIRVYTSAQLGYYGMDEILFGHKRHLLDSYNAFHHMAPIYAWQTDAKTIEAVQADLANPDLQQGQIFLIFWDATHFDYSWPKDEPPQFTPYAKDLAYFKAYQSSKNIELIKNRYRNSVHYVDSLFGHFWEHLPKRDEAVVIFMGDHGEEFFEEGHLFHNSHLVDEQIHIPLYFKFGTLSSVPDREVVSQMDIFPSIIDYLSGISPSFLQGESILRPSKWPYTLISRFNGGRTPYEFCLHNGQEKLIAQFKNKSEIFSFQPLNVKSLWDCKNSCHSECKTSLDSWIEEEFGPAFERLFPEKS